MILRCLTIIAILTLVGPGFANAQEWAREMFKVHSHDFGVVARGSKQEFRFTFENIYKEDIHIASVRSSCGCTTPTVTKDLVKTFEKADVVATYNTRSFLGHKSATITVTIDRPYYAEVQLNVRGFIRGDVVFEPGSVNFGELQAGEAAEQQVQVTYAGRSDWKIRDVRSANEHFEVQLKEEQRQSGRVTYNMTVRLRETAPVGFFKDQLTLITDDLNNSRIPLAVEGKVASSLTVYPQLLSFSAPAGETERKQLIVRGKQPFKILKIDCGGGECLKFTTSDEAKKVHVIPVVFTASDSGDIDREIRIETDFGSGSALTCRVQAKVSD